MLDSTSKRYEKQIHNFIVESISLTESNNHDQYNIDVYSVPFCKYDQIIDLLSRWSLKCFEQINLISAFYFKLIHYQPLIIIHLMKGDLNENKNDYEKFSNYFHKNNKIFDLIAKKEPKELMNLTIEYLNQLEKHKRFLPYFIHCKQKYEGNEDSLQLFQMYPEFTTPLSIHILSQYERNGTSDDKKRSNINQRIINYQLFLQCVISTNEQYVKKVFEWIEKRFTNEQLNVIENFLDKLISYNMRFNLEYLSNNINSIQTIIDIAINYSQQSTYTFQIILSYEIFLLRSIEQYSNKQQKEIIQQFAKKIIK
ncbi:unnamed protein product, partial [Rotaria sordida]